MGQPEVWGKGTIAIFLVIVAILVFGPLLMGPVSPPGIPLLLLFPVVLVALLIFLVVGGLACFTVEEHLTLFHELLTDSDLVDIFHEVHLKPPC
ncbi:hypothetical protein VNO77_25373 [Canavalia gladiata]|uniref:Uncharacterized protein n=1 Tax=Canavalia gladiata TaxID=3824 RepID=A0AAN9L8L2_CANGL